MFAWSSSYCWLLMSLDRVDCESSCALVVHCGHVGVGWVGRGRALSLVQPKELLKWVLSCPLRELKYWCCQPVMAAMIWAGSASSFMIMSCTKC